MDTNKNVSTVSNKLLRCFLFVNIKTKCFKHIDLNKSLYYNSDNRESFYILYK